MSDKYIKCKYCSNEILAQYNTDICDVCYYKGKMNDKELKRIAQKTVDAIFDVTSKWYADGYINQREVDRLIYWEFKLRNTLKPPTINTFIKKRLVIK